MKRYSLFLVFIVLLVIGVCLFQTHNQKKKATPPLPLPNEIVDHTPSSREIVSVKPEDVTRIPSQMDMKELADIHKAPTSSKQDEISSKTQSGGAGIKGIVKDKDTGEIVRDLPIKISNQKGNVTRLLNTKPEWKSDGSFIFTNLDGGTYHLVSEDDLYLLIVENIRVNSGEIKDLKGIFAEKMLAKIRVFTRDEQTNIPIQNCSISLIQIRQNLWRTGKTTKTGETDENGQFEAEKLISGHYLVFAQSRDYPETFRAVGLENGVTKELVIPMACGITIEGIVLEFDTKAPIENAQIKISGISGSNIFHTNKEGIFQIENISSKSSIRLEISAKGKIPVMEIIKRENLSEPITIYLEPGHYLGGRVIDTNGNPIESVKIDTQIKGGINITANTDISGRFLLEGLRDQTLWLNISKKDYASKQEIIEKLDVNDLEYVMELLGTYTFKVMHEDQTPVTDVFDVYLLGNFNRTHKQRVQNENGEFTMGTLQPGIYNIEVRVGESLGAINRIKVESGVRKHTETIIVKPLCRFQGQIVDGNAKPIPDVDIYPFYGKVDINSYLSSNIYKVPLGTSDQNGNFTFLWSEWDYTLGLQHEGYPTTSFQYTILSGETERKELLILKSGASLEIMVYHESSGKPASDVLINMDSSYISEHKSGKTDKEGYARFQNIHPGEYWINIHPSKESRMIQKANVGRNEITSVMFALPDMIKFSVKILKGTDPVCEETVNVDSIREPYYMWSGKTDRGGICFLQAHPGEFYLRLPNLSYSENLILRSDDEGKQFIFNISPYRLTIHLMDKETNASLKGGYIELIGVQYRPFHTSKNTPDGIVFENLSPGSYKVRTASFRGYISHETDDIIISGEEPEKEITIYLQKGISFRVTFIDQETGQKVQERLYGFSLQEKETKNSISIVSNYIPTGEEEFKVATPGTYIASGYSIHYKTMEKEITITEDTENRFEMSALPMAAVRFKAAEEVTDIMPDAPLSITLTKKENGKNYSMDPGNGNVYGPIPEGVYEYTLRLKGYQEDRGTIVLEKYKTTDVEVVLKRLEK